MEPEAVQALITARIVALAPTSDYYQQTTDAWRESNVPLIPAYDPDPLAHLSFFVDDSIGRLRPNSEAPSDSLFFSSPIEVQFLARIRASDRIPDWHRATKALRALWRQLLSFSADWSGDMTLIGDPNFYDRRVVGTGDYVVCRLRLTAIYESSTT